MEDHSQAISFANSYFSLVDGLAPGLEDHLAENVVLDWFGRTIRGRENVNAFMKAHKVGSRHVFKSITPVPEINYKKSEASRKISRAKTDNHHVSSLMQRELNFDKLSIRDDPAAIDPENNNVLPKSSSDIFDSEGNRTDEISTIYELGENDLANLFELEITATRAEEIEDNIKQIKIEEKTNNKKRKLFRREIGRALDGARDLIESTCTIKYIEANGQIEFSKKSNKRGPDLHTWRRQSQLQIAYSVITSEFFTHHDQRKDELHVGMETEDEVSSPETRYKIPQLKSLDEITEISSNLVPNINNFGGYFPSFDFAAERDNFLENFNAELTVKNTSASLRTPHYVDNRLVFSEANNKPRDYDKEVNKYQGNGFVFNYLIHLIIYQGSSRCRRSLTEEFDIPNKTNKQFSAKLGV